MSEKGFLSGILLAETSHTLRTHSETLSEKSKIILECVPKLNEQSIVRRTGENNQRYKLMPYPLKLVL